MFKRHTTRLIIVVLLLLVPTILSQTVRDKVFKILAPVEHYLVQKNTSAVNFIHNISQISELRDEKLQLQKQVMQLQQEVSKQKNLQTENDSLRKELGVSGVTHTTPKVLAHIIIQGSDPLERRFTIDLGSSQGLKVGQPAVAQGYLIGKVISVNKNTAVVQSIFSKNSVIQVWLSENQEKGLLIGDGNTVYLSEITQGIKVNDNSLIETSGLGGSMPQGILVGQTGTPESKQSDSAQKFQVTIPQDPSSLDSLFILLTDSPQN